MRSAGLLPYRDRDGLEVLIAHPGGPYFSGKDLGWWSLVKGLVKKGETDEMAAVREFEEETGWRVPDVPWIPLGQTELRSRKIVVAWALEYQFEVGGFSPGTFLLHGKTYPEIDRVEWVPAAEATRRLTHAQTVFIDRLVERLESE